MICNHKNDSPVGEFFELYSKLDDTDRAKLLGYVNALLDADKYSVKRRIIDQSNGIITVNFK